MTRARPDIRLERILAALGLEVAAATHEEVLAAATDLGLKPTMKGTVAFVGLKRYVLPYDPEKLDPNADAVVSDPAGELPSAPTDPK